MPEQQLTEEQRKELEEKIKNMSPEELQEFQKQQCVFCQIIKGKIPSKKVFEDETVIAILDINPAVKGHILVMPKEHYAIMPQMPDKEIRQLTLTCKYLSQILLRIFKLDGTSIFVANGLAAGQKAQHGMFHIIPRKDGDHLLDVEEKIIDSDMQKKVALAVRKKLHEVLGITKEIVNVGEKEVPKPKEVSKKSTQKKNSNREKIIENIERKEEEGEEASLDDIASLFK